MPPSGVSATRNRARAEAVIDWGFDPADDVLAPVEPGPRALRQVDPLGHPEPLDEDHPLDRERPPGHDRAPRPIAAAGGVPGRRTVQITGRGSERYSTAPSARDRVDRAGASRRPTPRRHERP